MKRSKSAPAYSLQKLQGIFDSTDSLRMTFSAMQGQYELDFSDQDVVDAIQTLAEMDFYKSMPPRHGGFTAWQDVYKSTFRGIGLYIKFQKDKFGEMIISFKRR